jgi:hypothetical protein
MRPEGTPNYKSITDEKRMPQLCSGSRKRKRELSYLRLRIPAENEPSPGFHLGGGDFDRSFYYPFIGFCVSGL